MESNVFNDLTQFRDDENHWTCKEIYISCAYDLHNDTESVIDLANCLGKLPSHPSKLKIHDTLPVRSLFYVAFLSRFLFIRL